MLEEECLQHSVARDSKVGISSSTSENVILESIETAGAIAKCAARSWIADNASTSGASLAFFCAFSIAPLLVIVLTTVGWIVDATAAFSLWLYYTSLIFLFGAEYTACLGGLRERKWA